MDTVYRLTTRPPHEDPKIRLTRETWPAYLAGYSCALVVALVAMDAALERRALFRRERARAAAERRRERRRLVDAARVSRGEQVGAIGEHFRDGVAERGQQMQWEFVSTCALRVGVTEGDSDCACLLVHDDAPFRRRVVDLGEHRATLDPQSPPVQLSQEFYTREKPATPPAPLGGGETGGPCSIRNEAHERRRPRSKLTHKQPRP